MKVLIVLLLSVPLFALAEDARFGRLFTDAAERRQLDNQRKVLKSNRIAETGTENGSATLDVIPPGSELAPLEVFEQAPAEIVFSGYLQRADGETFFWINGMIDQEQSSVVHHIQDGKALIKVNQQSVNLKPGQTWSDGERSIKEGYEGVDQSLVKSLLIENVTGDQRDDSQKE